MANLGQERLAGSNLSIAVDPNDSSRVYLAFAEGTNGLDYRIIGDHAHVLATGSDFLGIFAASNIPDDNNFPMGVT